MQAVQDFLLDKITLDDGRSSQNPDPAIHPNGSAFDLTNLFRGDDTVANVTGVMDYSFGLYRIQPTQGADYTNTNLRTASPDPVGGSLTVASFNVLNYFSTLDDSVNDICGPAQNQECRGADDATEFTRQRDKIISALTAIDADVVGLLEIENNINDDAVIDLVNGLNAAYGSNVYDYVATGTIGTDAIKVALIYKPASISMVGSYAILDSSVDSRFIDTKNRPTLAQTFMDSSTGGVFTVAVNHLKSKGSACDDVGDPDVGDGAGNCNLTRKAAAEAMVDWLAGDPTGSGDEDFLIIGDLNSYDKEDPIDAIVAGGYTDLAYHLNGEDAYSYVFDGQTGYLDYALASAGLMDEVTGVTEWHINADEADLIDYDTSFKGPNQDLIYASDAYRSSDHDPVIIGLNVCDEIAPVFDAVSVTPDTLWAANHKYVDVTATVVVSDNFDPDPTVTLVSVTSDEPDDGLGDGDTANDIVIVDKFTFKLRAERSGTGSGRIYTITYLVTDACGNSSTQSVTVSVPKSMSK
jgi:predicted extracellular nuclease